MDSRKIFLKKIVSGTSRGLMCAAASVGFVAIANAADIGGLTVKAPEWAPITWNGITVIGAIDISGQYESHGAPYAGNVYTPAAMITPWNREPTLLFAPNQSIQSYIGLKLDRALTNDLNVIGRIEMGFNPTTGAVSDALKDIQKNNGIALNQQTMNGDGSRAGQILNGEAWGGFDSKTWGAIHVGRNNAVSLDMLGAYDPLASYAFSLFGYVGNLAGQGSAETPRIDSSIKYLKSWGPFRTELMYGSPDTNVKQFYQGSFGYVLPNFSVDVLGGHTSDSVLAGALTNLVTLDPGTNHNVGSPFLGARVYDTNMYGIFSKYVFNVGGMGPINTPQSQFTLSGAYAHLTFSNPADGGYDVGHQTIGGYQLGPVISTNGSSAFGIVNNTYTGKNREMDISFIAGKYQYDSQLSFALAYYRFDQGSFGYGVTGATFSKTACSSSSFFNCAGNEQAVSFRTDYDWTKNLKLYAGITYSKVAGGFAFGYLTTSTFTPTIGARMTF